MGTRCQVKVTGTDVDGSASFTLYHHWDGYPSNMVPLIKKAFINTWQAGRVGKAVAMLCAADPLGYEVEHGHSLHGDIDFYYVLDVTVLDEGWELSVYSSPMNAEHTHDMKLLAKGNIDELDGEKIEKSIN